MKHFLATQVGLTVSAVGKTVPDGPYKPDTGNPPVQAVDAFLTPWLVMYRYDWDQQDVENEILKYWGGRNK